jgi:hypothetical protein
MTYLTAAPGGDPAAGEGQPSMWPSTLSTTTKTTTAP